MMSVPMIVVVQEDESDLDSVITFTEEDMHFWEDVVAPTGKMGLPSYPKRRPSAKRTVKNRSSAPPDLPERQASDPFLLADDYDDLSSCSSSEGDSNASKDTLTNPREIEVMEEKRSSDLPSLPQRRATFVFEDSVFDFIDVLSASDDDEEEDDEEDEDDIESQPIVYQVNLRRSSQFVPPRPPRRQLSMESHHQHQDPMEKVFQNRVDGLFLRKAGARIIPRIPSARSA